VEEEYKPPVKEEEYKEPVKEEEEYKEPAKTPIYVQEDNYEEEYEKPVYKPPVKEEDYENKQCYCPKPDGKDVYYVLYKDSYQLKGGKKLAACKDYFEYAYQMNYVPPSGWYWTLDDWNIYCDFSGYNHWMVFAKSSNKEYNFQRKWSDYDGGWKTDATSFWTGLDALFYYCNINEPCEMWLRYCNEYLLCYDIKATMFWLGSKDLGYVLYWSGLQLSYEHWSLGEYMVAQNVQKWSSEDSDYSSCAKANGGGWYATNNCKGLRWTSKGICLDLENETKCYKDWTWRVSRYTSR